MPNPTMAASATAPRGTRVPPRRNSQPLSFYREAIHEARMEALLSPVPFEEMLTVQLKPAFKTACWAYLPPHKMYVGTDLFEKPNVRDGMSDEVQRRYIGKHYHHELAHAFYTERDMKKVNQGCKAVNSPFQLFNLFEDARIEHRYRKEMKYLFNWLEAEVPKVEADPSSMLWALVQHEGDQVAVRKLVTALQGGGHLPRFERVQDYYFRICAQDSTLELMPILREWIREFGRPPEKQPDAGESDLETGARLAENPEEREEFEAGCEPLDAAKGKGKDDAIEPADKDAIAQSGTVLSENATPVDLRRANSVAEKLRKLFKSTSTRVSTWSPQRRISTRNFVLGRAPYRKAQEIGRGSRNIVLVIECSGSMSGFHMEEGKVLLSALSRLSQSGAITGHVLICASPMDGPVWELHTLPMAQKSIARVQALAAGEGLEYAMQANMPLLSKADYVFVYTDGQISDKAINKSFLHSRGIYTWGLYAGTNQKYLAKLSEYFDKALLRANAEELADAMLAQV